VRFPPWPNLWVGDVDHFMYSLIEILETLHADSLFFFFFNVFVTLNQFQIHKRVVKKGSFVVVLV